MFRAKLQLLPACAIWVFSMHIANAAPYEVVPVDTSSVVTSTQEVYTYRANILDNTTGKMYNCVIRLDIIPSPVRIKGQCASLPAFYQSTLSPSADLHTVLQPSKHQAAQLLRGGMWQINSNTGDLQFCVAFETGPGVTLPNACIKLIWKGTAPAEIPD